MNKKPITVLKPQNSKRLLGQLPYLNLRTLKTSLNLNSQVATFLQVTDSKHHFSSEFTQGYSSSVPWPLTRPLLDLITAYLDFQFIFMLDKSLEFME